MENSVVGFSAVSEQRDKLRRLVEPNDVLVHSFFASSDFEAFQMNHDWHGWGVWKPEPDWSEYRFTEEEALEQQLYLATRQNEGRP